jgi:hypothetical protein
MAAKMLATYSFTQHVIEVNNRRMGNFAKGDDVVAVTTREDTVTDDTGADGNMMVYINADQSVEVTLKFLHGAPENDFLKRQFDLFTQGQIDGISVSIWNTRDGKGEVARTGYIKKIPDNMRGNKAGDREWVIVCPSLDEQQAVR